MTIKNKWLTKELLYWIKERYAIRQRKAAGKGKPWTKNPILQQFRFCNVHREDDAVTRYIRQTWREPWDSDPNLWFAMVVARLVNWPDTLCDLSAAVFNGTDVKWNAKEFLREMNARKRRGVQVFNSAYIVSTNGKAMDKPEYLVEYVLNPLWKDRSMFTLHIKDGTFGLNDIELQALHNALTAYDGMGSFMAAQVVADVKYQSGWRQAPDWEWFAASGPGSRRGLNRVYGLDKDRPWGGEAKWYEALTILKDTMDPLIAKAGVPPVHAQDLQNCLCEFDKYERVRLGEGKPRNSYPGVK